MVNRTLGRFYEGTPGLELRRSVGKHPFNESGNTSGESREQEAWGEKTASRRLLHGAGLAVPGEEPSSWWKVASPIIRMTSHPGFPRTVLVLALKVLCPG